MTFHNDDDDNNLNRNQQWMRQKHDDDAIASAATSTGRTSTAPTPSRNYFPEQNSLIAHTWQGLGGNDSPLRCPTSNGVAALNSPPESLGGIMQRLRHSGVIGIGGGFPAASSTGSSRLPRGSGRSVMELLDDALDLVDHHGPPSGLRAVAPSPPRSSLSRRAIRSSGNGPQNANKSKGQ